MTQQKLSADAFRQLCQSVRRCASSLLGCRPDEREGEADILMRAFGELEGAEPARKSAALDAMKVETLAHALEVLRQRFPEWKEQPETPAADRKCGGCHYWIGRRGGQVGECDGPRSTAMSSAGEMLRFRTEVDQVAGQCAVYADRISSVMAA